MRYRKKGVVCSELQFNGEVCEIDCLQENE